MRCLLHRWSLWGEPHVIKSTRILKQYAGSVKNTIQARECKRCHLIEIRLIHEGALPDRVEMTDDAVATVKKLIDELP